MSLFRVVKYSSLLFLLGKYKDKLFRVVAVLLFALVTSLLYQDVVDYLSVEHPGTVVYALIGKIIIVYGALLFVLWQFKPAAKEAPSPLTELPVTKDKPSAVQAETTPEDNSPLSALSDLDGHSDLASRSQQLLRRK